MCIYVTSICFLACVKVNTLIKSEIFPSNSCIFLVIALFCFQPFIKSYTEGNEVRPNAIANLKKKKKKRSSIDFPVVSLWQKLLGCHFWGKKSCERFGGKAEGGKKSYNYGLLLYKAFIGNKAKRILLKKLSTFLPKAIQNFFFFLILFLFSKSVQIIIHLSKEYGHDKYVLLLCGEINDRLSLLLFWHSEKTYAFIFKLSCLEVSLFIASHGLNQIL